MKKLKKVLIIISIVILVLGVISIFSLSFFDLPKNDSTGIGGLGVLFADALIFALRVWVIIGAISIISLIWIIYGLISLFKKLSKNKRIIMIIIIFVILIFVILLIFFKINNASERFDFQINYSNYPYEYKINLYKDKVNVQVLENIVCIKDPCNPLITKNFNINFSNDNMEIIKNFIGKYQKNISYNAIAIYDSLLSNNEKKIINAIIYNDENLLKNVNKNLLFTLHSARLDCLTVILRVYDDKTYELETGYSKNKNTYKYGQYNYDVNKIIENANNYESNTIGPFILETDNVVINLYDNNTELFEFLDEIDINLDACLEYD